MCPTTVLSSKQCANSHKATNPAVRKPCKEGTLLHYGSAIPAELLHTNLLQIVDFSDPLPSSINDYCLSSVFTIKSLSAIKRKIVKLFCLQEAMSLLSCNIRFHLWFNQIHQPGEKPLLKSGILI